MSIYKQTPNGKTKITLNLDNDLNEKLNDMIEKNWNLNKTKIIIEILRKNL